MTAGAGPALQLGAFLPYLIALLAIIVMALMFVSVRYLREAKPNAGHGNSAPPDLPATGALERPPLRPLPESIKLASAYLRRLATGGAGTYEVPWVIAVGTGSADLDRALDNDEDIEVIHVTVGQGDHKWRLIREEKAALKKWRTEWLALLQCIVGLAHTLPFPANSARQSSRRT